MRFDLPAARQFLRATIFLLVASAILAGLFIWSGVYSVAASRGHWAIAEWLLRATMSNSVKTHSYGIEAPPFDEDMVRLGAAHFHSGCAYCHGAPGISIGPISLAMLPPPPELSTEVEQWRDRELFWIVKNGIKYTGMPAWATQTRDDEVWSLIAFLRWLPMLDAPSYEALALDKQNISSSSDAALVADCARCHGSEGRGPASKLVPILHGQPAEFLTAALDAYAQGTRASGIMQPIATARAPEDRANIARYYAALSLSSSDGMAASESVARGQTLAKDGYGGNPACEGCHSAQSLAIYPRLAGQNIRYIANRLRLWKNGLAPGTAGEAIMAPIARLLSEQQIDDVAAYYDSVR
jgi:cytochrome c553